jgi:4-amino-4-deoxy-L-arabinose transferase-like glycosyltransferase
VSEGARSARAPGHLEFAWALAIVALLPRLFVAIAWSREPVWDGHYYYFGAERIAQGLGYSEDVWINGRPEWKPWVHYPVGYSALLGALFTVFGTSTLVAPLFNALLGTATAVVTYELARRGLTEQRARIAGALVALHPGLIAQSALVMTETLAACLLVVAGLCAVSARDRGARLLPFGLSIGVATLVRPASLLLLPLGFVGHRRNLRALLTAGVLALCGTFVVVLPWTLRNCQRLDGCALVSTNGGWNLAIGALSESGRFATLRASDGCRVVSGQVQQDRCWAEVGLRKIAEAPGRWLALAPKKLAETFDHESFAIEYLHEADPRSWPEPRRVAGRELLTGFHRTLLVLAAFSVLAFVWKRQRGAAFGVQLTLSLGAVALGAYAFSSDAHPFYVFCGFIPLVAVLPLPGRPELGPCLRYAVGALFLTALTHVIFFGEDRYHLAVSPLLCLLAAAALRPSARA